MKIGFAHHVESQANVLHPSLWFVPFRLDVERIIALKRSHEAKQKHLIHPGTSHVKVWVSRNLYWCQYDWLPKRCLFLWQHFLFTVVLIHINVYNTKCSSGKKSWSLDIVWPNFENVTPVSHDDLTHQTSTSWVIFLKHCHWINLTSPQIYFVKCPTKTKILKGHMSCEIKKNYFLHCLFDITLFQEVKWQIL